MTEEILSNKEIADALEGAQAYLEQNGWCQNELQDVDGRACSLGALVFTTQWGQLVYDDLIWNPGGEQKANQVADRLIKVIALRNELDTEYHTQPDKVMTGITGWNDSVAENDEQVIDLFRTTAKMVRQGELDDIA